MKTVLTVTYEEGCAMFEAAEKVAQKFWTDTSEILGEYAQAFDAMLNAIGIEVRVASSEDEEEEEKEEEEEEIFSELESEFILFVTQQGVSYEDAKAMVKTLFRTEGE